jgi:hypothetical protein
MGSRAGRRPKPEWIAETGERVSFAAKKNGTPMAAVSKCPNRMPLIFSPQLTLPTEMNMHAIKTPDKTPSTLPAS